MDLINGSVFDRYGPGYYYPYTDIFPLKKCTYMGMDMLCPNNPLVVFHAFYGTEMADYRPKKICRHGVWVDRDDVSNAPSVKYYHRRTDLMF